MEGDRRRQVLVDVAAALPGQMQGGHDARGDEQGQAGEGARSRGVRMAAQHRGDPTVADDQLGEAGLAVLADGVDEGAVQHDRRVVEGHQHPLVDTGGVEDPLEPGEGLAVQAAVVAAGDARVAHRDQHPAEVRAPG